MTTAIRALTRGAWTEQYNQGWRFSRVKTGLWLLLIQIGIAILLLWRLVPSPRTLPLSLPVLTVTVQSLFSAFVIGLLRGREQLYGKSVLRLLHVSPASGASILAAMALAGLPQRAIGSLAVAAVVGLLLPAGALWWTIPLLWVLALLSGLVGYGAALLALVGWVRVEPRSLAIMWAVSMGLALGLANLLLALLLLGGSMAAIAAGLQVVAPWLMGIVLLLVGLPGLAMGLWVALRPGRAGEWYREAYLRMQELGDGRRGLRASRWPRVLAGAAGALQARQWREVWLNWFTWVRLVMTILMLGTLGWRPGPFTAMAERSPVLVIMGFGLLAVLGAFGELAGALGGSDGPNIGLSMVAGVRAVQVVKAKWIAILPMALLCAACTWVVGLLVGRPDLVLPLAAGCIGLGFGAIVLGGGLCDLDPHAEVTEREVPETLRAMLEQVPLKLGGILGTAAGIGFAVGALWACSRVSGAVLPLAIGLAGLAHLGLVPGYLHLRRLGM